MLEDRGYTDDHRYLQVCRDCARLWEAETGGRDRPPAQQCTCSGPPESWEGWDVAEWARLCDCCLGEVLQSGSRWSVWFCEDCKRRVMGLNAAIGMPLIPIGRHSLMHGITAHPDGPEIQVEAFVEAMSGLSGRMGTLGDWKEHRLGAIFDAFGLTSGVTLADYLEALEQADEPEFDKETSFSRLAAWFGVTLRDEESGGRGG